MFDACEGWRTSDVSHSMGGAVRLLRTVSDERLHALVSLVAVTHTREFVDRAFGHLEEGEPMLDKPHRPFSLALRATPQPVGTLAPRAREGRVPWLVVHGDENELVPLKIGNSEGLPESARLSPWPGTLRWRPLLPSGALSNGRAPHAPALLTPTSPARSRTVLPARPFDHDATKEEHPVRQLLPGCGASAIATRGLVLGSALGSAFDRRGDSRKYGEVGEGECKYGCVCIPHVCEIPV